jgi:hypothetical protein
VIAVLLDHRALKTLPRQELHELRKNEFASVHMSLRAGQKRQLRALRRSNRGHHSNTCSKLAINALSNNQNVFTGHYWVKGEE